ncbi:(E)-beta-caryophyllene synthase-like [Triticum dicoccoides]|uniref:(E)-beta-caryophyllene synthase-like n=1 Tax=Triticum dicoccoides TaxID=85692 RepID=UPI00188E05BC|nr:(E)-beta-caryophyllene synthase-like [Triticum dicoccoides]
MAASVESHRRPHPPAMNDNQRSHGFHHPTVWGDFFLGFRPFSPAQCISMKNKAEVIKEELRATIVDSGSVDLPQKLELVDTLQRLGLDYHYGTEINDLLCGIHDAGDEAHDLHTAALRFYLLRKQGLNVSPDVFLKFIDDEGKITCNDTRSLLGVYNAAHVRTHGEETLSSAMAYAKDHLERAVEQQTIPPSILLDQVRRALKTPLFRRPRRVEARHFISVYERMSTRNEAILELAKLDFSILQALYCEELRALTLWWEGLQLQDHLSFARDRMVEMHFWMLGVLFEPQYSYGRIVLTKFFTFISIFDDIYDSYSTLEESRLLTMAMERWDEQAAEHLPGYTKFFYRKVLATMKVIEKDLDSQGNKHADYVKKLTYKTNIIIFVVLKVITYTYEEHVLLMFNNNKAATLQTPAEVWHTILAMFAAQSQAQAINTSIELTNLQKGNMAMAEYLARLKVSQMKFPVLPPRSSVRRLYPRSMPVWTWNITMSSQCLLLG